MEEKWLFNKGEESIIIYGLIDDQNQINKFESKSRKIIKW